ncbi:MAG TPA: transglutaminase domain-containing protein, partial [Gammaproteobacteria bacterium]|nr:transglutaminase domain-containing protein [Gammaproteobacteria bacterium]
MVHGFSIHEFLERWGRSLLINILVMACFQVSADPLAETREVLFSCDASQLDCEQGEIAKQAADLRSPAAMYEYVRNTHEYTLYQGSRSNTINTWLGKRGSDVDIASVLIAMYRSQAIPARYAVGVVSAPATEVANWLGVKNVSLATAIMDDQGIQKVKLTTDGTTRVIEFEHAWVQVQVPYDDYRGAFATTINCTTTPEYCQWINIDPSWKQRKFNNTSIDIYGVVNFDYTRYYNAIKNNDPEYRDKNPTEIYEAQILDYLKANFPGKTLNDVADPGVIIPVHDGILPASLPYKVISNINTYDSIVLHDADTTQKGWAKFLTIRYSLGAFTFTGSLVGPFILSSSSDPIALADLSTKRITLSYFEGNQISGDPYEHHQMVVRLDGQIIDTPILIAWQNDQAQYLGRLFDVTFELDGAPSTTGGSDNIISATYRNLMFGGYYVIGTGGDTSNWSQVHRAAKQLLQANETYPIVNNGTGIPYVDSNGNGVIDTGEGRLLDDPVAQDALTGGLLNVAMSQYYSRFVENTRHLDALNHVISPIEGFVGIVSSTYDVDYLGTTAFSVMPGGLLIDMKGQQFSGAWRNDSPATFANAHFELIGHAMSSLEHEIWQEITGFDAVSTVRGIQMALANGTQLLDLTTGSATEINGMYGNFGFTSQPQSPFSISVRDVFSTRPTTWSHSSTAGDDGFTMLKKLPSSVNDPRSAQLTYSNTFLYDN